MKTIALTQNKFATVDDDDFEWLRQYRWCARQNFRQNKQFYALSHIRENGKSVSIQMHRLIMGCKTNDGKIVDHKDGNPLNNQKSNLRFCTRSENAKNRVASGTSKYLGVSFNIRNNKYFRKKTNDYKFYSSPCWAAEININGTPKKIGYFKSEIEAAKAYNREAKKHHGEFARLNTIL